MPSSAEAASGWRVLADCIQTVLASAAAAADGRRRVWSRYHQRTSIPKWLMRDSPSKGGVDKNDRADLELHSNIRSKATFWCDKKSTQDGECDDDCLVKELPSTSNWRRRREEDGRTRRLRILWNISNSSLLFVKPNTACFCLCICHVLIAPF